MKRNFVSLVGALTTTVLLVSTPAAQAAVTPKDAASQGDISKAFPALVGGTFSTDKAKVIGVPGKTCGVNGEQKAKVIATTGVSTTGQPIVVAGVAELSSKAKAKSYLAKYKTFIKKCSTYTDPTTGATVSLAQVKAPKVGQAAVAVSQETSILGTTTYSTAVVILQGKRIGNVVALDAAPVSSASVTKLAKVAAKKMK